MPRCSNCGVSATNTEDGFLNETGDGGRLCTECEEDYLSYCDQNREELAAQERYENFLAEC